MILSVKQIKNKRYDKMALLAQITSDNANFIIRNSTEEALRELADMAANLWLYKVLEDTEELPIERELYSVAREILDGGASDE